MKILVRIGLIILIIALLIFAKSKWFPKEESAGPMQMGGKKGPQDIPVAALVVKTEKLDNNIYASGSVLANESVELKPEVSGKITQLNFQEGKAVSKGALLVKINDVDLQAQLNKIKFQLKLAKETEARQAKLLAIKGISQEEYDVVSNQINTLNADIDYIQAQIAKTEIRAPFNGVIGLRNLSNGSYVSPTNIIATLHQVDPIKIDFSVPEKYAYSIKVGDPIQFTIEGSNNKFIGKVYATEQEIDPETRTLKLRAIAPNSSSKIIPGAFVKVLLSLQATPNAMMIPTECIIPILKGQQVYLAKNGTAKPQKVEIGVRNDTKVQILSGLEPGDTVIRTGIMQLKPDAKVKLIKVN